MIYSLNNVKQMNKPIDEMFDLMNVPLIYASRGVNVDFAKHVSANMDADLYAEALSTLWVYDSPVTILEKTLTTTGGAQTLVMDAPVIGDVNIADSSRAVCVDLSFQLNNFTLPKAGIKFDIKYIDGTGVNMPSRQQSIEGTVAVLDGDTRQYIRALCFEQNSTLATSGSTSVQDGKLISLPVFRRPNSTNLAALAVATGLTLAQLRTIVANLATDVATIVIDIPAGAFPVGVELTCCIVTIGRNGLIAEVMKSLDTLKSVAGASMTDSGRSSLLTRAIESVKTAVA